MLFEHVVLSSMLQSDQDSNIEVRHVSSWLL